jgi:hypothetical protein
MVRRVLIAAFALSLLPLPAGAAQPAFDPTAFVDRVENPWFPLPPGRTLRYRGEDEGVPGREVFTILHCTKTILGVTATVVHDRIYHHGRVSEDTLDYYAQDRDGNVWYLGEDTAELDRHGHVRTREGSWRAGVHGAQPGIFMPGKPKVGQSFRQEYLEGHAEDHFKIVRLHGNRMRTIEWSPLEPGVRDAKVYVRGRGTVLEKTLKGGDERWELVSISR